MSNEISWRPYQVECKTAIKTSFDKGIFKQLIVQATGTGKRWEAIDLMHHFKRTLFIAHREELIMQAYEDIDKLFPMQVGIVKAQRFEIDRRIVVASVQTLYNRLGKIDPILFDLVIVDEAHHYMAKSYIACLRHFEPRLLTGWTATPNRLDGLNLSNLFQEVTFTYPIAKGIQEGYLAKLDAYQIQTHGDLSNVGKVGGDFNKKQLSDAVDTELRNNLIVHKYKEYAEGRQAIAFCVDINHAYNLKRHFVDNGISCEAVTSDTERCPNRSEILSRFSKGEITVLTNVMILTEGYDYNDVGCVLAARPTQSETVYVQSIGRGTRPKSDKFQETFKHDHVAGNCIVLDFVDNCGRHSLVNAHELDKGIAIEERVFLPAEHKEKLIEAREAREHKIQSRISTDNRVNLLEIPEFQMGNWRVEKMEEMATEAQIGFLQRLGIYQAEIEYTKFQASEAISNEPAGTWQLNYLASLKYDISKGATIGQYQKIKQAQENGGQRKSRKKAMDPKEIEKAIIRMKGL